MTFLYPLLEKGVSLFMENPLGQWLWFIAMLILFYWFAQKDDTRVIIILNISNIFWIAHFYMIDNIWALLATLIAMLRLYLSLKYKWSMGAMVFVTLACLISWIFAYSEPVSILPIVATIAASYGFFFLDKVNLRLILLLVSSMWFVYHLETGSISWVINEIIVTITLLITIYRFNYSEEKSIYLKNSIKNIFKKRPQRIDLGRYMFLRDKDRFISEK